jgi:CRISPR-associated endonuclease/helicase Cas3
LARHFVITSAALWAKLKRDPRGRVIGWHSLVDHSADVAAVVEALLLQPTIRGRLATAAGWTDLDEGTRARLSALAFLHDIGKANRGFRARVDPEAPPVGHIDQLAWVFFGDGLAARIRERLVAVLGLERLFSWCPEGAEGLFHAVFAHHGRPWRTEALPPCHQFWEQRAEGDPVSDLRPMRDALDRWFRLAFEDGPLLPRAPAFHHHFAGLLMLADWLGSDERFFPFANGTEPDRMRFARSQSATAIATIGLTAELTRAALPRTLSFQSAFAVEKPRPIQVEAAVPKAQIIVLESETGSGKTEAALWRFVSLFRRGIVDGLYFALPTRVAATQMFERVKRFRDRVFSEGDQPAVVLAVPGQIRADEAEAVRLPGFEVQWNDAPEDAPEVRARWAAEHPKRFLAAQIAVGTIDQALLGVLRIRHAHMRGTALLRHLFVVDEVHASDRYMEALLAALLRDHAAAGGHALLLSATLGAGMRTRILEVPSTTLAESEALPYPALSFSEASQERVLAIEESGNEKTVSIASFPIIGAPAEVAKLAIKTAESGGKVLVIRNTVAAAMATAQTLETLVDRSSSVLFRVERSTGEFVSTLHHSRFGPEDRRLLDKTVQQRIGRDRLNGALIVVGTQTLEQSLDLDADLLLTDLCPIDVLLQRIGRLHRHTRVRPSGVETPRAFILVPVERDLLVGRLSRFGLGMGRTGGVYEDLRIIELTWRLIETYRTWRIPTMNRRLVEAATHPERLGAIEAELSHRSSAWNEHFAKGEGKTFAAITAAASALLDRRKPFDQFHIDADERLATRLGARDRLVTFEVPPQGPFGLAVSSLRIPHHLLGDVPEAVLPVGIVETPEGFSFQLGDQMFKYNRFGLVRGSGSQ